MPPELAATALATPSEPALPIWPWSVGKVWVMPAVQFGAPALERYSVKTPEVPDLSERTKTWIGRLGPGAPLSAAMAGSFQLVIPPAKILPRVGPVSFRLVSPGTLNRTATAPEVSGM